VEDPAGLNLNDCGRSVHGGYVVCTLGYVVFNRTVEIPLNPPFKKGGLFGLIVHVSIADSQSKSRRDVRFVARQFIAGYQAPPPPNTIRGADGPLTRLILSYNATNGRNGYP
jgi:hypothetical protein